MKYTSLTFLTSTNLNETKIKSEDFYFQFALVGKRYAELREARRFLNLNYKK